jgi:hypothetical protein
VGRDRERERESECVYMSVCVYGVVSVCFSLVLGS